MYDYPDYEDFYTEPSEYDMMVEEFKESLRKSVSKEWVDKMNRLKKENEELQEFKKNYNQIKRDFENEKAKCRYEVERVTREAEQKAKRMRLNELLDGLQKYYWRVGFKYMHVPKCNKCNENRQIEYKKPSGKIAYEDCDCRSKVTVLEPACEVLYEISLRDGKFCSWFKLKQTDSCSNNYYGDSTDYFNDKMIITDDIDISKLNHEVKGRFYFESEEKCQEFCDWYNKNVLGIDTSSLVRDINE